MVSDCCIACSQGRNGVGAERNGVSQERDGSSQECIHRSPDAGFLSSERTFVCHEYRRGWAEALVSSQEGIGVGAECVFRSRERDGSPPEPPFRLQEPPGSSLERLSWAGQILCNDREPQAACRGRRFISIAG
jgi:hypothetical protein